MIPWFPDSLPGLSLIPQRHRFRSAARQEKRIIALRACKRMIESPGCSTPFPFEAAIWLWEETEELYGGQLAGLPVSLGGTIVTSMPQAQNVRLLCPQLSV